ncbi:hypothetical protein HXX76_004501 [Chlamydomonas incerta]|uniref:Uncharacterized protein n=1 Tax=Chlamydomonas incerta TaxID=51695 RepID=A0A835T5C3_CHLIN|nr:hypothetical protein HXX76_004501 [Chlamydomonas incerta]|eukprot:KAG2439134.1 hypothetical protein HXX76_004501 [Chlamydomonas incerta]
MKDIEQAVAAILEKQKKQPDGLLSLILDSTCKATHVKGLDAFINLKTLSLCSLGLTSLEGFPKLPKLERLILTDNRITGGLQHLVDAGLTSLRVLELANNRISRVEELESLKGLPSLQILDVDACPLATKADFDPKKVFTMLKELKYLNGADEEGRERDGDEEEEDLEEEAGEEEYEEGGGEGEEEFEDEEGAEYEEKEYAALVGPEAVGEDEEGDYQDEGEGDDDDEEGEDEEDEGAEGAEPAAGGTKRKREDEEGADEGDE